MTDKEQLMREYNQAVFAVLELVLFLDTHPYDREALAAHRHYVMMAASLRAEYERLFGPLTSAAVTNTHCWDWIEGPWPWQNEKEVRYVDL